MKVNTVIDKLATAAEKLPKAEPKVKPVVEAVEPDSGTPEHHHGLIFQPSEQMKNMLALIARDNPKLYNRIVGME